MPKNTETARIYFAKASDEAFWKQSRIAGSF
jgi:hypothetical protein